MSALTKEKPQEIVTTLATNGASASHIATVPLSSSNISSNGHYGKEEIVASYSLDMDDPYRYGWRYLTETAGDEITITGRIPLTLEDLLHPEEEDFRMQNLAHTKACGDLVTMTSKQLPNALILYDMRVDWNAPGIRPFGPDITVITDGEVDPPEKGTFVVGEDGVAPIMVIEVTSPSTRDQDFYDKPRLLQQAGLPYYFVVDLATRKKRVYGYELNPEGHYIGIRPDDQGRVWMEPVALWLGLNGSRIECYNAQNELILTYKELDQALGFVRAWANEESQRADEEAQRANEETKTRKDAEERANEEAEMRRVAEKRAQADARRANEEAEMRRVAEERAQADARRANEEAEMRRVTEERALSEMQLVAARLRELGIDPATVLPSSNLNA